MGSNTNGNGTAAAAPPEGKSKAAAALAVATSFELFAFRPSPRYKGESYGSVVGLALSVVIIVIMILYVVTTISRFVDGNVSISIQRIPLNPVTNAFVPFTLQLPRIADPTFFTVEVQLRTVPALGASTIKTPIQMVTLGPDLLASPDLSNHSLFGNCQQEACAYLRVKVYPCENTSVISAGRACVPLANISDIVDSNYMRMILNMTERDVVSPAITDVSLKTGLSFRRQFRFNQLRKKIRPNFVSAFRTTIFLELGLDAQVFSIDRLPRLTSGADTEFCKIDFELTGMRVQEDHNVQTMPDMVGSWAALYSAMFGVCLIFLTKYNMWRFYKERPEWDHFNDAFVREPPPPEEGELQAPEVKPCPGNGAARNWSPRNGTAAAHANETELKHVR